ncbi:MAG TPA: glycosyltransferase family 39 protein [Blastococcus sp.]|nr:glycosyltransferase family 39 protein [Blastococcus sp.]
MTATLPTAPAATTTSRSTRTSLRLRSVLRGRADDAAWVRPALITLLGATGVLYLWDLAASGWANAFYSAAAQAGSTNWESFFYASSDAGNSITVDKPPAALWVMSLSVRLFGLSSWSVLVPEALMGVATVGVLYLAVRRVAGPSAGLVAGLAMALTPVAVLMFRYDNPDALLVLLLTLAAYALVRATEKASGRWLALVGVLVGLAFLTKMLQALLVLPAFALVYLIAAPTGLGRRMAHLAGAGLALLLSAGWWVAIVELVPASMRPYIGGSQTNSVWELIWGYNGLGRITGSETGSVGGRGGWGETGIDRLFTAEVGGQVAWLLPAAVVLGVAGLVAVGRAPRTDARRASLLLWGGWLVVTGLVFSLMAGIFHAYYTVALAPAIAALVGIGGQLMWQRRERVWPRIVLAATLAGTVTWAWALLARSADFYPWLKWLLLVAGLLVAVGILVADRVGRAAAAVLAVAAVLASLGAPAAYALDTASTAHSGSIPSAGPVVAGGGFGAGPGRFGRFTGGRGALPPLGLGAPPGGGGGALPGPQNGFPGSAVPGLPGAFRGPAGATGTPGPGGGRFGGRGLGGLLDAAQVSADVAATLSEDASSYTWVAAAVGSNRAAGYQLAAQRPVMPIGGFNGSDPSPTLAQFQQYVADGKVHWFIGGGMGMRSDGGSSSSQQIASWVTANFPATTVDGVTLYDLTRPTG